MGAVEHEAALVAQPLCQGVYQVGFGVDHGTAAVTDDMHVLVLGGPEGRRAVPEVRMPYEPEALEQLQRPVHGRDVDTGHRFGNLFRRRVAESPDRGQNLLTLWRHPHPAGAQPGDELLLVGRGTPIAGHGAMVWRHQRSVAWPG